MATRIIEFATDGKSVRTVFPMPPVAVQSPITASASSQQSDALNARTNLVSIDSDEKVHIAVGENPTATTDDLSVAAGGSREFEVAKGASLKIAIIAGA